MASIGCPIYLRLTENEWRILLASGFLLTALVAWFAALPGHRLRAAVVPGLMAASLIIYNLSAVFTTWLSIWGRTLPGLTLPKIVTRISASIAVITQPTMTILGYTFLVAALYVIFQVGEKWRPAAGAMILALCASLIFFGSPLALVGTPYIIIAAYAVRSLPASVRAGVASLQQIDPSIEEASADLGANSQYTFRNITLPSDPAGLHRRADLCLCPPHDQPLCRDLLDHGRMAYPDGMDFERGGAGRHEHRCSLFRDPDLDCTGRHRPDVSVAGPNVPQPRRHRSEYGRRLDQRSRTDTIHACPCS